MVLKELPKPKHAEITALFVQCLKREEKKKEKKERERERKETACECVVLKIKIMILNVFLCGTRNPRLCTIAHRLDLTGKR